MNGVRTYRLLTVICLLIVAANTWVAARSLETLLDAEHSLTHTLDVLSKAQTTTNDLFATYNDSRAFWLTGYEPFRERSTLR